MTSQARPFVQRGVEKLYPEIVACLCVATEWKSLFFPTVLQDALYRRHDIKRGFARANQRACLVGISVVAIVSRISPQFVYGEVHPTRD